MKKLSIHSLGTCLLAVLLFSSGAASWLYGGGPLYVWDGQPVVWAGPVAYRTDQGYLGELTNAEATELVRSSFDVWESVATASISFQHMGQLPMDVTSTNFNRLNGYDNPIVFDANGTLTDMLLGYGASDAILGFSAPIYDAPRIVGGRTVINGKMVHRDSLEGVRAVMAHEFGHLIGLHHTQVNLWDAFDDDPENDALVPLMFPLLLEGSRAEARADDAAWVSYLYPSPDFVSTTASISGQVFRTHGSPLTGANLCAIPLDSDGVPIPAGVVSSVSGFLLNGDGAYLIPGLGGGDFLLYMEPLFPFGLYLGEGSDIGPPNKFYNFYAEYYNGIGEGNSLSDSSDESDVLRLLPGTTTRGMDLIANEWTNTFVYPGDDETRTFVFPSDFWFPFFGRYYNAVSVSTNGFISFRSDPSWVDPFASRLESDVPIIAPLFSDLDPATAGAISVEFFEDRVEILWDSIPFYGASEEEGTNTFSLTLSRSGEIAIEYFEIARNAGTDAQPVIVGVGPGTRTAGESIDWTSLGADPVGLGEVPLYEDFRTEGIDLSEKRITLQPAPSESGLTAEPNLFQICDGTPRVRSTIQWSTDRSGVEVRLRSSIGTVFSRGRSAGNVETGTWVTDGMNFLLLDQTDRQVYGVDTVRTTTDGCGIVFRTETNPVMVCDGRTSVAIRLEWTAPAVERVEIRIDSPKGTLLTRGPSSGSFGTGDLVVDGTTFYLVNPENHGVLAQQTIHVTTDGCGPRIYVWPSPARICNPLGLGAVTLHWDAEREGMMQIRVGSPDGKLMARVRSSGSLQTGAWARDGMEFYLLDDATGEVLGQVVTQTTEAGCVRSLVADPNPIQVCDLSGLGRTTLSWQIEGSSGVQVRLGSPEGVLFTEGHGEGTGTTGKWVREGTVFYAVDSATGRQMADLTVHLTEGGCDQLFWAMPAAITECASAGRGETTLHWNVPDVERVEIRVGSPDGALLAISGSQESKHTGTWVRDGMRFYLLNAMTREVIGALSVPVACP